MIVCSKRVFLNILTQLMDVNTLINANYYIADQTTRNGIAQFSDNISINGDGEYFIKHETTTGATLNPYHIHYGDDTLSPLSLMSQLMFEQTGKSVDQLFKEKLLCNDSLANTYNFLYADKSKGNGLRIMIFVNESCVPYIHIVCEYVSELFGEDITFVDKQYRGNIPGQFQYTGNKYKASQILQEIMDYKMLRDVQDISNNYQYGFGGITNLEVFFAGMSVPKLFYMYERIFPNEPLPVGNYTKEHMIHIITRKLMHAYPQMAGVENLMIPSFADMSSLYNEISDEELMEVHE